LSKKYLTHLTLPRLPHVSLAIIIFWIKYSIKVI
jgi:hypothetical protein